MIWTNGNLCLEDFQTRPPPIVFRNPTFTDLHIETNFSWLYASICTNVCEILTHINPQEGIHLPRLEVNRQLCIFFTDSSCALKGCLSFTCVIGMIFTYVNAIYMQIVLMCQHIIMFAKVTIFTSKWVHQMVLGLFGFFMFFLKTF